MSSSDQPADTISRVHALRRAWKPLKARIGSTKAGQSTNIRFHRACSWMHRVDEAGETQDLEWVLLGRWIALNALYGQWNLERGEPLQDRETWRRFLGQILELDSSGHLREALTEHKPLVISLLEDEYLQGHYWRDPSDHKARQCKRDGRNARTWYIQDRWAMILDCVVDRIYFLRCQLVHGAATLGSRLNRTSLRRSSVMLGHLLEAILKVWVEKGADRDWGPMCYPPQAQSGRNASAYA